MRVLLCLVVLALLAPAGADAAQGQSRLVAAANVRLRAEPSEEVKIITTVPLGTNVTELEVTPDRQWVRVRTSDGREGWMREGLSRRVPDGQVVGVAQRIIYERLARTGDGFASWIELESFIDRMRADLTDREVEARFALFRLQAISATARAGERYNRPLAPAFAEWLEAHKSLLARNEPGGVWIVRRDVILAEHDRFKGTREGDQIAWFAVTNGLGGECEGFVVCYLTRDDLLWAEYLRRQPAGFSVRTALGELRERATYYREDLIPRPGLLDAVSDCADFLAAITRIQEAVTGVDTSAHRIERVADRDRALTAISELRASVPACKADRFWVQHR